MLNCKEYIRVCLLYEYKLGHNTVEATHNICHAIAPGAISTSTAFRWFERFRNGDESLEDEPRSGRSTKIDLTELKDAIESDPKLGTLNLATTHGCTDRNIRYIFKRFGLVNKLGGWSPHDLNTNQLQKRVQACQHLMSLHRNFKWLDNLITGDEKWVLYVNVERKHQWLKPGQKPIPTPKAGLHPQKRMLCVWWDIEGVIYWELLPEKATINATRYRAQLHKLAAEVQKRRRGRRKIYLLHDNARPHIAKTVNEKLKSLEWELIPHPPYSPDIAPSDYHLFLSLSNQLRGENFKNETELKRFIQSFFDSKSKDFYAKGIYDLPRRWQEIIATNGKYVSKK
jgi:histone-lysine N-methyltransferase SETMAR